MATLFREQDVWQASRRRPGKPDKDLNGLTTITPTNEMLELPAVTLVYLQR